MVGVTHVTAPIALLERVSVPRDDRARLLDALRDQGCAEAVVLSTCSRTEIYASHGPEDTGVLLDALSEHTGLGVRELQNVAEVRTDEAVVDHLFRLAAGLESRMIGEIEIFGQVRSAFREAQKVGMTGRTLGQLFPAALRCGTRVREETTLGAQGRSLGHRAVDIGLESLGPIEDPIIMVVGSGKMASSAVEHLAQLGQRPIVAARNQLEAARLVGPEFVCPLPALAKGI